MPGFPFADWIGSAQARAGGAAWCAAGFALGLCALPAIALGHSWIALGFILAGRALAFLGRDAQALSAALDATFFAGLPFAFALADPGRGPAAAFLLFAFAASIATTRRLARGDEAVALSGFAAACIRPELFGLVAYALGIACFAMAGLRLSKSLA